VLAACSGHGSFGSALVERGLCESREKAKRAIMAGRIKINERLARKPSDSSSRPTNSPWPRPRDLSAAAAQARTRLQSFPPRRVRPDGIDLGASTGGFTDCLLQRGAVKVFAVDVGRGSLPGNCVATPGGVMEKTNARQLTPAKFPPPFVPADLVVIDCSFISLQKFSRPPLHYSPVR